MSLVIGTALVTLPEYVSEEEEDGDPDNPTEAWEVPRLVVDVDPGTDLVTDEAVTVQLWSRVDWTINDPSNHFGSWQRRINGSILEETLTMTGGLTLSTTKPIDYIISTTGTVWDNRGDTHSHVDDDFDLSHTGGTDTLTNDDETITDLYGYLTVEYMSTGALEYEHDGWEDADIYPTWAEREAPSGGVIGSQAIVFTVTEPSPSARVIVTVQDYGTDEVIEGASVYTDDVYRGLSDEDGIVDCGIHSSGTHTLKITAPDYTDSDEDELSNDSFTI
jgi:hypothetical protein